MDLFLMRHGKAGARTPSTADSSRALTSAGTREVKKAASGLRRAGISFDYVASSPLARAMQTARIVAAAAAGGRGADAAAGRKKGRSARPSAVHRWDELKPEAAAAPALERIAGLAYDSSVLLVGHEPSMTMLLGLLVSGGAGAGGGARRRGPPPAPAPSAPALSINLKKGGMARLRILSTVPEARGELRWLATPRHLECLQ